MHVVHYQLVGDALLMYGIDVKRLSDLAQHEAKLKSLASGKFRTGTAADKLMKMVSSHQTKLDEVLDDTARKGIICC